ncbi:MAG: SRPBCC domain-containing protein [Verrucomicrobiae bacterium]|nr:SRPBCC domain-containing protein [Verrucomicrobiae bacterium]
MASRGNRSDQPLHPRAGFCSLSRTDRLAKWWGPAGFTNTFHEFDFQKGGRWHFTMHGTDGAKTSGSSDALIRTKRPRCGMTAPRS